MDQADGNIEFFVQLSTKVVGDGGKTRDALRCTDQPLGIDIWLCFGGCEARHVE